MTLPKRYRTETKESIGKVRTETGTFIATVEYILNIKHEFSVWKDKEIQGLDSIGGRVRVLEGEKMLLGKGLLVLDLENGQVASFHVKKAIDLVNGVYQIVVSGGLRSS